MIATSNGDVLPKRRDHFIEKVQMKSMIELSC